jgi:hypothetical protein
MPTQCNAEQLEFACVERRRVVAAFDGGTVSSDAKALLLDQTDAEIGSIDRLAGWTDVSPKARNHRWAHTSLHRVSVCPPRNLRRLRQGPLQRLHTWS